MKAKRPVVYTGGGVVQGGAAEELVQDAPDGAPEVPASIAEEPEKLEVDDANHL